MEAAQADADLDKSVKDSLRNRPLGSVKVSPQDRMAEYELNRQSAETGDVAPFLVYFNDQNATEEQVIKFLKEMESKRGPR